MCHGHPHHHPCGHQSVKWHYCPRALIDLDTGYETSCDKATFASSQPSKASCPLQKCEFKTHGTRWICCACKQGPNERGWCAFDRPHWEQNHLTGDWAWVESCDHGCCKNCTGSLPPEEMAKIPAKNGGTRSRKQTSKTSGRRAPDRRPDEADPASRQGSRGGSSYDVQLDYGGGKAQPPQRKKRKAREREE